MDIQFSGEYYENVRKAFESIKEVANGVLENLSECIQATCNAISELINSIDWSEFIKVAIENAKSRRKPIRNYPEHNCIKPNTKPYSAFKRLYRVQMR